MEAEIYKMTYKIGKNQRNLRILGEDFVKNNRNKGFLNINNKKYPLKEIISANNIEPNKIKIILKEDIFNKSCMFKNCESLESLLKIQNNNCTEINNAEINNDEYYQKSTDNQEQTDTKYYLDFNDEEDSLYNNIYPQISEIEKEEEECLDNNIILYYYNELRYSKSNYTILKEMFCNCELLTSLPDLSKWNTDNVVDMSSMFYNCKSLSSLPDISEWNTKNVRDMNNIFSNCESLISLPDISKWNFENVCDMSYMFYNCKSLSSLPNISKWNINNVSDMSWIFYNCESLFFLPDISK